MFKRILSLILATILCFGICSCGNIQKNYSKTYLNVFDTATTISGYFNSEEQFENCAEKIIVFLEKYHKMFDIYNNYDKMNNIKTINDNAGVKPVEVDSEIINLLEFSKKVYNLTDGAVNVCAGPLIAKWKLSLEKGEIPNSSEIENANELNSISNLVVDKNNNTVFLKQKGCSIDVGAVAKGFVGEKVKIFAKSIGFEKGIINLGGNVVTIGTKPNGNKFSIGIANPDDTTKNLYTVNVSDESVVTSGDYERFYEIDGVKYNHIINPKTYFPAKNNKSVTIISDDVALADALSTALFIMDYNDGLKLINSIENCEAVVVDADSKVHFSKEFKKYLELED